MKRNSFFLTAAAGLCATAGLLAASAASAETLNYSGDTALNADGTLANPNGVCDPCAYDVQGFSVDVDGLYDISAMYPGNAAQGENLDGYLLLYQGSFDPLNPGDFVDYNDDGPGGTTTSVMPGVSLTSGLSYFLVTTAFDDVPTSFGQPTGAFQNTITGPGSISLLADDATSFRYSGLISLCTAGCDAFAALGGPGGAVYAFPSAFAGFVRAVVAPDSTFTEADIDGFAFEILNAAKPLEEYDGSNATTANPFPVDPSTATVTAQGSTDANGNLADGMLRLTLTDPVFAGLGFVVEIDLNTGEAQGCSADDCTAANNPVFTVDGGFSGATEPVISVSPLLVDYGRVDVGDTETLSVSIINVGAGNLAIGAIGVPDAPFFISDDACSGQSLAPFEACHIAVDAMPLNAGLFIDTLTISSNDPRNPLVTVNLVYVGVPLAVPRPDIEVAIAPKLGVASVGSIVNRPFAIVNRGNAPLSLGQIGGEDALTAPFSLSSDLCSGASVSAGRRCFVVLQFSPTAAGAFTDSFDIPSNDPDEPSITVNVSAEAVPAPVPVPLDILPQTCPNLLDVNAPLTERVVVAILGTQDLDVSTIDVASIRINGFCPSRSRTEDIGTPFEPFLGRETPDDCNDLGGDGIDDLVLELRRFIFLKHLGEVAVGEIRTLKLKGEFKAQFGGRKFTGEDVIVIVDQPGARRR